MTYYKLLHIKRILFVVAIIFSSICFSNSKTDSLENILIKAKGEAKLSILNSLAFRYRLSNPDNTIKYGFEALKMSDSLENLKEKHAALSNIGMGYRYLGKYDDALEYQQKALEAAGLLENEKYVAVEFNRIGIIYKRLGLYGLALEYYLKALNIREKLNDKTGISNMYNNIGNVYRKRGDLDLALEYYFKTLKIENELDDKEGYAYILNNIGNVYSDLKMYDKSLEYHKESLKVKEQLGNKYGIATSIRNIGEIYLNLNKPQRALEYFEKQLDLATEINDINGIAAAKTDIGRAYINLRDFSVAEKYLEESLEIIEKTGDKVGIIHACVSFSDFYIELEEYEKAIKFLDSSLEMAKEEEFMENLRDIYLNYSIIFSNLNKPTKALDYYKKYTAIKDSIFNSEISSKITELQIQRSSEELEKEKTLLEDKNTFQQLLLAKKNQLIYALIAITILIFILIILVYNRFLNKQRIEKKLREANATKDKFFSIIAHDLSNPFNSIMGFANLLHLEYDYHTDEEKRSMIDNLHKVSENTYKLLQNLLEWAKTQTNNLNFVPEVLDLGEITDENITIFKSVANSKNIVVNSELNGELKVVGDKNMVKTILRNLISNAIKFTPDGGFVNISASEKKKNVEICIKDNGTGIKPEDLKKLFIIDDHLHSKGTANENGSGLGLILCKEFVEINGGKIWAKSQYGKESKFIFTLPLN